MIFLIQKVDLRAEFLHNFLVLILVVLHGKLLVILAALVKLAKPQDFDVPRFNAFLHLFELSFKISVAFLEVVASESDLVGALVGLPELSGPLLVPKSRDTAPILVQSRRIVLSIVLVIIISVNTMVHLDGLLGTPDHIMWETVARHTSNDLVLTRHVQFIKNFVQLLLHLEYLRFKLLNSRVLLLIQKPEVLCFILGLAKGGLPAELDLIESLLPLDNLQMKLIVLLDKSFVLMLQG